jgi:hypothetical protein
MPPELIPAEDIGWGDRASNAPLLHGRRASPRGCPQAASRAAQAKRVTSEGLRAFTGSYKAQNLERGPRHSTNSGNLRSRNPMLQSLGFRHFAQLPASRASG